MDIVIAANFCRDFSPSDNGRFVYLAKMLVADNEVEIITSNFEHGLKKHREPVFHSWPFKITLLYESGYKKNVSLRRLVSHRVLAKSLTEYLKNRKKPDVIYCAIPSLDFAEAAMRYAVKNGIRFIIDIQDLWPEAFKMAFHVPVVSDIIFAPMKKQANRIYKNANHIVAVSKAYADRALKVNHETSATVAFLGTAIDMFDRYSNGIEKNTDKTRLVYIGSLSDSYDIPTVLNALRLLTEDERNQLEFVIMGDGHLRPKFEEMADGLPVRFTGRLPYPTMVKELVKCDIAVNPIKKGSAGSIINKVGDYAMAGLPVINTQECQEYRSLLEDFTAGINCACESAIEVSEAVRILFSNKKLRYELGVGSKKMGKELFDRQQSYQIILDIIQRNK